MTTMDIIIIFLMNTFSFLVMGITGFGATVLAQPTNISVLGLNIAIPFSTLITFPCQLYLGFKTMKNVAWKQLLKIGIICVPGLFLGQYMATIMDPDISKTIIGIFVSVIALKGLYEVFVKTPKLIKKAQEEDPTKVITEIETEDGPLKKAFNYICLFLGGAMQGAYVIGGPLITVYVLSAIKDKTVFRNTMNWLWIILNCVLNFTSQLSKGMYAQEGLWLIVGIGAVAAFVGYFIGIKVHDKLSKQLFLKITYVMLLLTGANMLIQALGALGII